MRIRVLGGGWYGCHISLALLERGHEVELHEIADRLFAGASGANPARLHMGWHYPRSAMTRRLCQEHVPVFLDRYGDLTNGIPVNIYAIAAHDSLVDFGTYMQTMRGDGLAFIPIHKPKEYGFQNLEGALMTGERHIVIDKARAYFAEKLKDHVRFGQTPDEPDDGFDLTLDCTFCANDSENIDRYEPCLAVLLEGPTDVALTVMDGGFPSLYPWDEDRSLCSLTSAALTPLSKDCKTYDEGKQGIKRFTRTDAVERGTAMMRQLCHYWPAARDLFRPVDYLLSIRAQPRSGSDARFVDVVQTGPKRLRVRAGKIDAIFQAEHIVAAHIDAARRALKSQMNALRATA